jgi:NitT/TauT family transport system ATP-binding protein
LDIQIKEIYKSYSDLKVIEGLNLSFPSNRIHCFFGPSGCGKTTLVNIITKITDVDSGQIEGVQGKTFSYIFQEDRLLPWATLEANILFVLQSIYSKAEAVKLTEKYLSLVDLLKFKNYYPDELSGGMKQRASIARAFAYGGDMLVMDEPFKGLDFELKKVLMDYIVNYWYQNNPFLLFITHDIDEALYLADDIHIFDGPPLNMKKKISIEIPLMDRAKYKKDMERYRKDIEAEIIRHKNC